MHFPIHFTRRAHEYPVTLKLLSCTTALLSYQLVAHRISRYQLVAHRISHYQLVAHRISRYLIQLTL